MFDQVKLVPDKLKTFMDILQKSIDESSYNGKLGLLFCYSSSGMTFVRSSVERLSY